jgi:hypothetical protein
MWVMGNVNMGAYDLAGDAEPWQRTPENVQTWRGISTRTATVPACLVDTDVINAPAPG